MPTDPALIEDLSSGTLRMTGQFRLGSNRTYLVEVASSNGPLAAVYKPAQGERPLWDFPGRTLAQREIAAYLLSEALGWDLVPPTVYRHTGPSGAGSLQLFVEADPKVHYFTLDPSQKELLRPAAIFDILINNADRKAGHILLASPDRIQLIDHGVCFHQEYKLRTVIWDFAGELIPQVLIRELETLKSQLRDDGSLSRALAPLLTTIEIEALRSRNEALLAEAHFPVPAPERNYPWPLI